MKKKSGLDITDWPDMDAEIDLDAVSDDNVHESMYQRGVKPEELWQEKDRKAYIAWIVKHGDTQ